MNRFKAVMLCSFGLARGKFIGLIILEIIMAAAFGLVKDASMLPVLPFSDLPLVIFLFVFGIIFSAGHTAFCIANSVSARYRIISFFSVMAAMCLLAAILSLIMQAFIPFDYNLSTAETARLVIIGGNIRKYPSAASFAENIFYYALVISLGSFLGTVRSGKGDRFTLISLAVTLALVFGFKKLGEITWINPAAWLCVIPAVMLERRLTAVIFYAAAAFGILYLAYVLSVGGVSRKPSRKKLKKQKA